ncbi:MAG TPA: hypothetical protein VK864_16450 [Longimicrobiales bacterium]|nr:hypothetical protein [Longimicrobiales bacterium]
MRIKYSIGLASAVLACGALIGLSGCRKEAEQQNGAGATQETTAAPVSVVDVELGRGVGADKKITNETDQFTPQDQVYASVHTTGSATSATITARWNFEDGTLVDERAETISPSGDAYTEFHIAKPSGWPAGKYTLHVLLDGREVASKDFTVK